MRLTAHAKMRRLPDPEASCSNSCISITQASNSMVSPDLIGIADRSLVGKRGGDFPKASQITFCKYASLSCDNDAKIYMWVNLQERLPWYAWNVNRT